MDLGLFGTPKTSAIIFAAIPPIGPPNAVPNVGATAPTIFFNNPFIFTPMYILVRVLIYLLLLLVLIILIYNYFF